MFRSPRSTSRAEKNKNRIPFLLLNDDSAICTPARRMTRAMAKHPVEKSPPVVSIKRSEATTSTKKGILRQAAVADEAPIGIDVSVSNGNSGGQPVQKKKKSLNKTDVVSLNETDGKEDSAAPITSGRFVRALNDSMNTAHDSETKNRQTNGSKRRSKQSLNKTDFEDLEGKVSNDVAPIHTPGRFVRSFEKSIDEPNELNTTFDASKEEIGATNSKSVIDLTDSPMPLEVTKLNETFDAEKDGTFTKEKDDTFTKDTENDGESKEIAVKTPNVSNRRKTLTPKTEPAKSSGNKASGKISNLSKLSHTIGSSRNKSTGNKLANPSKLKGLQLAKVIETAASLAANSDKSTGENKAKVGESELRSQLQQGFAMYTERQQRDQNANSSVNKSKVRNVPNFKGIHEREFAKSVSIDQHQKGIEERAKMLTSGKKLDDKENFPKPSDVKSRRKLDMAGAKAKAATTKPIEISKKTTIKSEIPISITKPKPKPKEERVFTFSAAPINKEHVGGSKVEEKANQRRRESGSEREQRRLAMFKKSNAQKPKVRTNRRFELLMKFRNKS